MVPPPWPAPNGGAGEQPRPRATVTPDTGAVQVAVPGEPTPAEVEAPLETLMRVHVRQLRAALAAGRLELALGASRGLMPLREAAGPPLAAAAFAKACGE